MSTDGVWVHPAIRSGEPCVGGTRVPVDMVVRLVWENDVEVAMDTWELTRGQVLNACWYAAVVNVTRVHKRGGEYSTKRGPWRKRWGAWAKQVHGDLWKSTVNDDVIPNPPGSAEDQR